ncbi:1678_t:CDS:1, partial [Gigaspora rosea]
VDAITSVWFGSVIGTRYDGASNISVSSSSGSSGSGTRILLCALYMSN